MAMLSISIPIPTERIIFKKDGTGKPRRVYHVEKRYQNALGTPTAKDRQRRPRSTRQDDSQ